MAETVVDMATWPRAAQYAFFRTFERPHYAISVRLDVSHLMQVRKPQGTSVYRASLFAIGAGLTAVPELLMRFRADEVVQHDTVTLSMTVPTKAGAFNYAYVPFDHDFAVFDARAAAIIAEAGKSDDLRPNANSDDAVAYLSCLPWLDYTSLNNAMPGPDDCIPRVSWGKVVEDSPGRWQMMMTIEVHHALVDGTHVSAFFDAVQAALNR